MGADARADPIWCWGVAGKGVAGTAVTDPEHITTLTRRGAVAKAVPSQVGAVTGDMLQLSVLDAG